MRGERAVPVVDAAQLVEQLPVLSAVPALETETLLTVPSAQLSLRQALEVAQRAAEAAAGGEGVVITTGTDTMEELAVLCAMLHAGEAPIVLTGANRPGSAPGADGAANLLDAVALAGSAAAAELGVVVVFGGEIHGAMTVRKVDSTGPAAFGSPSAGPLGRIVAGRVWLHARPLRPGRLRVERLEHRVAIVPVALGDDGEALGQAATSGDGVVLVALGAGTFPVGARGAAYRGRARAGGRDLPPGSLLDAVRDLRIRGGRGRPAGDRRGLRAVPLTAGGAGRAAVLPRRRSGPRADRRGTGAMGRGLIRAVHRSSRPGLVCV